MFPMCGDTINYTFGSPWLAGSKMVPSDLYPLVFVPLCNCLPVIVGWLMIRF